MSFLIYLSLTNIFLLDLYLLQKLLVKFISIHHRRLFLYFNLNFHLIYHHHSLNYNPKIEKNILSIFVVVTHNLHFPFCLYLLENKC